MLERLPSILAAAVLAFSVATKVIAGPYEDARAAYNKGDYATALSFLRQLAEQGDSDAQNQLGFMYEQGQGVPQDNAQALKWYRSAGQHGNPDAQTSLGNMYNAGQGVPQDYAEALKLYRRAAERGLARAQNSLALMYHNGRGIPQDYAEAMRWYLLAAEQGDARAQYNLGVMYEAGQGVLRDYVAAHMWFNLAASRHKPGRARDDAVQNRDRVESKMTPAQILEAQRLARDWKSNKDQRASALKLIGLDRSWVTRDGATFLVIQGRIVNEGDTAITIPPLRGVLSDSENRELQVWLFRASKDRVEPGESVSFHTEVREPHAAATGLSITFTIGS